MKTYFFAATILALSLPQLVQAAIPPQPQRCPTAAAIQAVGVSRNMIQDNDGLWVTGRRNQKYGTTDDWTFLIGKFPATTANQAYTKAVTAMTTLNFQMGPLNGPLSKWICWYSTAEGYTATAINPPITSNVEPGVFLKK